jgi:NAD(P)-dependent dehydrogenase (short-subunit alcohol dehydrogenase family)
MRPGAAIVNTTSIQSKDPSPQLLAYAATKGAISNFTAALAQMLADRGIRVNAVAPGPIWTPLIPSTMPAEKVASFRPASTTHARGPAQGAGTGVCAAGVGRGELHLRGGRAGDRRRSDAVGVRGDRLGCPNRLPGNDRSGATGLMMDQHAFGGEACRLKRLEPKAPPRPRGQGR